MNPFGRILTLQVISLSIHLDSKCFSFSLAFQLICITFFPISLDGRGARPRRFRSKSRNIGSLQKKPQNWITVNKLRTLMHACMLSLLHVTYK